MVTSLRRFRDARQNSLVGQYSKEVSRRLSTRRTSIDREAWMRGMWCGCARVRARAVPRVLMCALGRRRRVSRAGVFALFVVDGTMGWMFHIDNHRQDLHGLTIGPHGGSHKYWYNSRQDQACLTGSSSILHPTQCTILSLLLL